MKRAQRLKDMSTRHEKRSLVNGNGEQKLNTGLYTTSLVLSLVQYVYIISNIMQIVM